MLASPGTVAAGSVGAQAAGLNELSQRDLGIVQLVTRVGLSADDPDDDLPKVAEVRDDGKAKFDADRSERELRAAGIEARRIVQEANSIQRAAKRTSGPPWRARAIDRTKR